MSKKEIDFKFSEEKLLKDFYEYICSTYDQHYIGRNGQLLEEYDKGSPDAEGFCLVSARKYLKRFGKKENKNKLDIMKAMHFLLLLQYFLNDEGTI